MHSLAPITMVAIMSGALAGPAFADQSTQSPQSPRSARPAMLSGTQAEAVREHVDEAEDLVDSLLRWRHIVAWSDRGKLEAPPPEGPVNTLISIERAHVQKLTGLLDAVAAQVPAAPGKAEGMRGDLRAHLEKAQEIARELQPPHATVVSNAANAAGGLVTIDRTTLERLNVELNAMEGLLPRVTR